MNNTPKNGGCGCGGGRRRAHTRKAKKGSKRGGSVVADALLAGTALGLYSYFTKKRGGKRHTTRKH